MSKSKVGRPRSEKSREAVIQATHALLGEQGVAGLTIEAIAKRAKVGKPTIYRWWTTLGDIVLEALLHQAAAEITVPAFESLEKSLYHFLLQSMKSINDGAGIHLRCLMAQAQQDEDFRQRFRDSFTAKRREVLRSLFQQGVKRGEIHPDKNLDMLVDVIFGAMWYRLLIGHGPMDEGFADELTKVIMKLA